MSSDFDFPLVADYEISTIPFAEATSPTLASFREIIAEIKSDRWKREVEEIQSAYQRGWNNPTPKEIRGRMETIEEARERCAKDEAGPLKLRIPGALFSGTFSYRSADKLIKHSGLICADLDKLGSSVGSIKEQLSADPHVLAAFVSPTGTGLKVVFRCDPTKDHKHETFHALKHYVAQHFGLAIDEKCSDVSRICFFSHDPEAFLTDDATVIPYPPPREKKTFTPKTINPSGELSVIDDYNARGGAEIPDILTSHGWTHINGYYWWRPGKSAGSCSASWGYVADNVLNVFSDSTETGLPSDKDGFDAFAIYLHLEHRGDIHAAVKALGARGYGTPAKSRQQLTLERVAGPTPTPDPIGPSLPKDARAITSYAYPSEDDPNIILGSDDYLGRGGGLLFVSHAGAGKSSWAMDACMMWSLGRPWMQIKAHAPRKILIIQAEDSDRYIGKIFASFAHANKLSSDDLKKMGENCKIIRLKGVSGAAFFSELKRLTDLHQPDLVVINPIYLYAEGDITRSEFAAPFLIGLDAINRDEKFAYILIHHTGKPQAKGNNGKRAEVEDWESAYMGFGSSYLANWPRASILLEPVPGNAGHYLIKLGKGGFNAGVTRQVQQGVGFREEPVTRIAIRHSKDRMPVNGKDRPVYYWEMDDMPTEEAAPRKGGRPAEHDVQDILQFIPIGKEFAKPAGQIFRDTNGATGMSDRGFSKMLFRSARDGTGVVLTNIPGKGPCFHI